LLKNENCGLKNANVQDKYFLFSKFPLCILQLTEPNDSKRQTVTNHPSLAGEVAPQIHHGFPALCPASRRVLSFRANSKSAATIISMSWANLTLGAQPNLFLALEASSDKSFTSVGRKYRGSI
jgi:hypothetical protein